MPVAHRIGQHPVPYVVQQFRHWAPRPGQRLLGEPRAVRVGHRSPHRPAGYGGQVTDCHVRG
ncbi:hypothetical protein [Streptomyces sp. AC550_RSS872]|uniref:hypothetical protein n=1 Tax=Streptomyces sp. AC550_RSS872 TaxID=2823689 RepID=UPI0020B7F2F6|nr:hypothetical protein [Streptomyces sp. AC550_RSS872]